MSNFERATRQASGADLARTPAVSSPGPGRDVAAWLASRQNADGGWPYSTGVSWTEPTVYALLAMLGAGRAAEVERGIEWLRNTGRHDGGWAPQQGVEESTWVTALVALVPPERLGGRRHARAIEWLLRHTGRETTFTYRLRQWMLGFPTPSDQRHHGWPWYPGAAAWVGPTSIAMLALKREYRRDPSAELARRIEDGRLYLLSRRCADGGWNHGSARALGQDGRSYPETTGMALAALAGMAAGGMEKSLAAAGRFLAGERSADGRNWLTLGLMAHNRSLPALRSDPAPCRTTGDAALCLLTGHAAGGANWLIPS